MYATNHAYFALILVRGMTLNHRFEINRLCEIGPAMCDRVHSLLVTGFTAFLWPNGLERYFLHEIQMKIIGLLFSLIVF